MSEHAARRSQARAAAERAGLDALVVSDPRNRRYLTGFTGSAGFAVIGAGRLGDRIVTDGRYYEQVAAEAPDIELVEGGAKTVDALGAALLAMGVRSAGFEADHVTCSALDGLERASAGVSWRPTSAVVESLRVSKSPAEVERIRRAVELADRAMEHAYVTARPGMRERDLAWSIERFMRENGAEAAAFDTIVAAGENSARPHHRPTDRALRAGEPIVVDLGARVDGYHSDVTRTFCIGDPEDPHFSHVWRLVEESNRAATAALRAGSLGREIDAVARDVLSAAGMGDDFKHGLGHGVGLDIHEAPRLGQAAPDVPLPRGAVVTVEPGVYLEGRFGVRIEDMVLIGETGAEVLTAVDKRSILDAATGLELLGEGDDGRRAHG